MKIDLDDPLWNRLYAPHGLAEVAGPLAALTECWDDATAQDLFWEKLHHQGDLCPVTYAALPWLWDLADLPEARAAVLGFLAWVIHCAFRPEEMAGKREAGERFRGLSLDLAVHRQAGLPEGQGLTAEDMAVLAALDGWFDTHALAMANAAARAIDGPDPGIAAHLLLGLATLNKGHGLADAIEGFADGCPPEDLSDPAEDPPGLALRLAFYARPCAPLAHFLASRAAAQAA